MIKWYYLLSRTLWWSPCGEFERNGKIQNHKRRVFICRSEENKGSIREVIIFNSYKNMMIINIRKYVLLTIDILWILLVLNQYRIWTMFVLYSNEYGKSDIFPALVSFTIFSVLLIIIPILTILRIWR